MTSTDRTRLSRIWRKASTTMSPERTWIRAPLFWARASFECVNRAPHRGPCHGTPHGIIDCFPIRVERHQVALCLALRDDPTMMIEIVELEKTRFFAGADRCLTRSLFEKRTGRAIDKVIRSPYVLSLSRKSLLRVHCGRKMALRVISRQRGNSVAFGAKRTFSEQRGALTESDVRVRALIGALRPKANSRLTCRRGARAEIRNAWYRSDTICRPK